MTPIDLAKVLKGAYLNRENDVLHLHEPQFMGREKERVNACLESTFVSSVGKYVSEFEEQLSLLHDGMNVVATHTGTSALQLCLRVAGVKPEDEVLLPSLTFVATANAVSYMGATPHFVESERESLGVAPEKLRTYLEKNTTLKADGCYSKNSLKRISALVVMHTFGHIGRMRELKVLCDDFKIELVEDAAESLGSKRDLLPMGSWGKCSALSFNGNKIITTGGGGAFISREERLAKRAKHLSSTAKLAHPWAFEHDEVAYNFRMPNLNAALGLGQLEQLPLFLTKKQKLFEHLLHSFSSYSDDFELFVPPKECESNQWLNAIQLKGQLQDHRDQILQACHDVGLMVRPVWTLIHRLPMFKDCPRMDLPVAGDLERSLINLPSSAFLGENLGA